MRAKIRTTTSYVLLPLAALLTTIACTPTAETSETMSIMDSYLPDATLLESYQHTLTVEGGVPPITVGIHSGQLPPGIVQSGKTLSGTPTAVGNYSFVIRVTDATDLLISKNLTINVSAPQLGMKLGTTSLPVATINQQYSAALSVSGGKPPYKFQQVGGDLPRGLSLDGQTGIISGVPILSGSFGITILVTDTQLQQLKQEVGMIVITRPSSDIVPSLTPSVTTGVAPLSVFFDASGTVSKTYTKAFHHLAYNWNFGDAGSLRPLSTGPVAAHVFQNPGSYTIQLAVTQPDGKSASKSVTIKVTNPDSVFSGAKTIAFSNTKDFTGAPTGSTHVTTSSFDTAMGQLKSGVRLLFKRGDTFTNTSSNQLTCSSPTIIGAFGKGATPDSRGIYANNPKIVSTNSAIPMEFRGSDLRIMDLTFNDGANNSHAVFSDSHRVSRTLMLRVKATSYDSPFGFGQGIIEYYKIAPHELVTIADCFSDRPRSYGIFASGKRIAFLGNTVERSQKTHLMRIQYTIGCVIDRNHLLYPGGTRHALKLHNEATKSRYGKQSKDIVIRENEIRGTTPWLVTLGPQNANYNEEVSNVIVEKNRITSYDGVQVDLYINSSLTTIRNNIFFNAGAKAWTLQGILVTRRGVEPVPSGVEVYNNTYYNGIKGTHEDFLLFVEQHQGQVIVKNNLLFAPQSPTHAAAAGKSTLLSADGNLDNKDPKFINTATVDLRLGTGSPALKAGKKVPVVDDIQGTLRPTNGASPDIGAYQK